MFWRLIILILLLVFSTLGMVNAKESEPSEKIKFSLAKIQLPFIENRGQLHEDVTHYVKTFGGTVFVTRDGRLVYSLLEGREVEKSKVKRVLKVAKGMEEERVPLRGVVLYESFVGGVIRGIKGEEPSQTKVSYFKGNDPSKWVSGLCTYGLVNFGEVYEGIEVKLRAYGNNVEKFFYVKPGASPEAIKVKIEGGKIKVNEKGELEVETELGVVRFTKPIAYQEVDGKRVEVTVSYKVIQENDRETIYAFSVGEYERTKPLVIDPLLASTFIGGSNSEYSYSITLDSFGNVYVTGGTWSSDFPTTPGAFDKGYNGDGDVFIAKLNNDLSKLLASTFFGGYDTDWGESIVLDKEGNVYVAGVLTSINGDYDFFYSEV